jgi:hypothetical protein
VGSLLRRLSLETSLRTLPLQEEQRRANLSSSSATGGGPPRPAWRRCWAWLGEKEREKKKKKTRSGEERENEKSENDSCYELPFLSPDLFSFCPFPFLSGEACVRHLLRSSSRLRSRARPRASPPRPEGARARERPRRQARRRPPRAASDRRPLPWRRPRRSWPGPRRCSLRRLDSKPLPARGLVPEGSGAVHDDEAGRGGSRARGILAVGDADGRGGRGEPLGAEGLLLGLVGDGGASELDDDEARAGHLGEVWERFGNASCLEVRGDPLTSLL